MPVIDIYKNKKTGAFVFVPFAKSTTGAANAASGKMIHVSQDEFAASGGARVRSELAAFWTRDASIRSELYNEMSPADRRKFLRQHSGVTVFHRERDRELAVFSNESGAQILSLRSDCSDEELTAALINALQ